MKKRFKQVCQFKITLKHIKPPVWRRIQVPETYTLWELHVAIQDAMGWTDTHLHRFDITDSKTGILEEIGYPDKDFDLDRSILPGWKQKIAGWFSENNSTAEYTYDFGDNWEHTVKFEKILPREKDIAYPRCIDGKRACPPEDCGGVGGYEDFLEIIMDPHNQSYDEMLEWVGGDFDPEHFNPDEVFFDDPDERLEFALS
jgi:Plasmid pRiA4b ORF-3-like protein